MLALLWGNLGGVIRRATFDPASCRENGADLGGGGGRGGPCFSDTVT